MENQIEIWKDIKGCEGRYQISNLGRVKTMKGTAIDKRGRLSTRKEMILKNAITTNGYLNIYLGKPYSKMFRVHRLVALHFIENPNNYPCLDHIDCNPLNANALNLRWCTLAMNQQYSIALGRGNRPFGISKKDAKLTDEKVKEIRLLYKTGKYTHRKLAEIYEIDHSNITRALNGKLWKHVA